MDTELLSERVRGLLGHIHLIESDDLESDEFYHKKFADIGALSDEEIERFAASYCGWFGRKGDDYRKVIKNLTRMRDVHKKFSLH